MSRLRAFFQLVRLPAVPTALADIGLGVLVTHSWPDRWASALSLALASACLYAAGMVWNDYFDVDQDRHERPARPIPSGRVKPNEAKWFATGLMLVGLVLGLLADFVRGQRGDDWLATKISIALAGAILLYDGWLKRTWIGPISMGTCRFLNVLLGVSVNGTLAWPTGAHLALVVGLYIAGVTWFARTEARISNRAGLTAAVVVIFVALALALPVPLHGTMGESSSLFPYLLVLLGFLVGLPISRALKRPTPEFVQASVRRCLFCLIVLDAVLATALVGNSGLVLLALLLPTVYLNGRRWLYAT